MSFTPHIVSIRTFGAKGDGQQVTDGAMTATINTLTCATSTPFVASDVGKTIVVRGAGTAGADLITTIATFTSSSVVHLTATAGTSVTNALVTWGTDDSTVFQTAVTALAGTSTILYIQKGFYVIGTTVNIPSNITIDGTSKATIFGAISGSYPATGSIFRAAISGGALASTTLSANAVLGAKTLSVTSATSIVPGTMLYVSSSTTARRMHYFVEAVNGTTITVERGITTPFVSTDTVSVYNGSQIPQNIRLYGRGMQILGTGVVTISFQTARDCYVDNLIFGQGDSSSPSDAFFGWNNACYRCTASRLVADGYVGASPSVAFAPESGEDCIFEYCRVNWSAGYGMSFVESVNCRFISCNVQSAQFGYVWSNDILTHPGSINCATIGCIADGCTQSGFFVGSGSTNSQIIGCSSKYNAANGYVVDGTQPVADTIIADSEAIGNAFDGVFITAGAKGTILSNLTLNSNGLQAIGALDEFIATGIRASCLTGSQPGISIAGGDCRISNFNLLHNTGGAAAFFISVTGGILTLANGEISVGVSGDVCLEPAGGTVYVEATRFVAVSGATGTYGIYTPAGTVHIGVDCDFSGVANTVVTAGGTILGPVIYSLTQYNGPTGGPPTVTTFTNQFIVQTTDATQTTIATIALDDNTLTDIDCEVSGKEVSTSDTFRVKLAISYVRSGGSPIAVGTLTSSDSRSNGTGSGWSATISPSGNNALIQVTGASSTTVNFTTLVQWRKTT